MMAAIAFGLLFLGITCLIICAQAAYYDRVDPDWLDRSLDYRRRTGRDKHHTR